MSEARRVGSGCSPHWEYRIERFYPDDAPSHGEHRGSGLAMMSDRLAGLGDDGWELVAVGFGLPYELVFKRSVFDVPVAEKAG